MCIVYRLDTLSYLNAMFLAHFPWLGAGTDQYLFPIQLGIKKMSFFIGAFASVIRKQIKTEHMCLPCLLGGHLLFVHFLITRVLALEILKTWWKSGKNRYSYEDPDKRKGPDIDLS